MRGPLFRIDGNRTFAQDKHIVCLRQSLFFPRMQSIIVANYARSGRVWVEDSHVLPSLSGK